MGHLTFPTTSSSTRSLGPGTPDSITYPPCAKPLASSDSTTAKSSSFFAASAQRPTRCRQKSWRATTERGYGSVRRPERMMEWSGAGGDGGEGAGSHGPGRLRSSLRERVATSCSECRRRKQRCNQGQPCSNCARRFPPPICEYRALQGHRGRSRIGTSPGGNLPQTSLPGDMDIPGISEPLLQPPSGQSSYPAPATTGYVPSPLPLAEASWSGVTITTHYPGAASSSSAAADGSEDVGAMTSPWGQSLWGTQEHMSGHRQYPGSSAFPPSPSMAAFSPSMSDHSNMQDASRLLEARNMIPQQFLAPAESPAGSSAQSSMSPGGGREGFPTQFAFPWDMGGQMQWASTPTFHTPVADLSGIPVAPTKLNGELVHIFVNLLSRFKASLDGNPDAANPYVKHYVPWCLSSPLLSHVALYTSACFLSETKRLDHTVTMALKGQAIGMLNKHLRGEKKASDEAIAAIMQLILDEWYWGERRDLAAHLGGMREMISLRGGLGALGLNGLLGKLAFSADRAICLSLEAQPFLSPPEAPFGTGDMASAPFRVPHNTPLLAGQVTFAACADAVDLHPVTASILDDVRFLINTVLKLPSRPTEQESKKLETTARWIHNRISSLPQLSPLAPSPDAMSENTGQESAQSQQDFLHQSIRLTSLVYTTAVLGRRPLTESCTTAQFLSIWTTAGRIPLTTWKGMLGVFIWLTLAVAPTAAKTEHARFVKNMLTISCTQLGLENWEMAEQAMERMLMLQRWLSGGVGEPESSIQGVGTPPGEKSKEDEES